jgi:CheY-like chemotaxis protein
MDDNRTRDSYSSGKSLRILVVEDHSDTLQALSRLLTHFGHEISLADGAQNALNAIESEEFDVVLCDIALPDGSGYDVIAEAKRKRPVKAVALTGFGGTEDIERGKEAGFDFHLTKPVDFHELRAVLGQIAA